MSKASRREHDKPGVGGGLLQGVGREQCRSLGLERGRRPFCQMKAGSSRQKGVGGLTGSRAVQGHEVWVQLCLQHSSCPKYCLARRSHLFSEQLGHEDSRYQLLKGKA